MFKKQGQSPLETIFLPFRIDIEFAEAIITQASLGVSVDEWDKYSQVNRLMSYTTAALASSILLIKMIYKAKKNLAVNNENELI